MPEQTAAPIEITIEGTSHGDGYELHIENFPEGIYREEPYMKEEVADRRPGQQYTTGRPETDEYVEKQGISPAGMTTGEPIEVFFPNRGQRSEAYRKVIEDRKLRPGHGIIMELLINPDVDQRGGGPASARRTIGHVWAGALADLALNQRLAEDQPIETIAYLESLADIDADVPENVTAAEIKASPVGCPDPEASELMRALLDGLKEIEQVSAGGVVVVRTTGFPGGISGANGRGLRSELGSWLFDVNGVIDVGFGVGWDAIRMRGSEYNDTPKHVDFETVDYEAETNRAGGVLGRYSMGRHMPIVNRVAFRPTSSIGRLQDTITWSNERAQIEVPGDHDPAIAVRGRVVAKGVRRIGLLRAAQASGRI